MLRLQRILVAGTILFLASAITVAAAPETRGPQPKNQAALPDLSEFRTADKAITTRISLAPPAPRPQPSYLGVAVDATKDAKLVIALVEPESPAAAAGLRPGDLLVKVDGQPIARRTTLQELLQAKAPGNTLRVEIQRQTKPMELTVKLGAASRPLAADTPRAIMGVRTYNTDDGVRIERVTPRAPADKAGLKAEDVIVKVNDVPVANQEKLAQVLGDRQPGDTVTVVVKRGGKEHPRKVTLAGEPRRGPGRRGWDRRTFRMWRKEVYRLAVVPIEFADIKHNDKVARKDWQTALFSQGSYLGKSVTGQKVYGSLNDYYREISCQKFHIEGKVFDNVAVAKDRAAYRRDDNFTLFSEALDQLPAKNGKDALKNFDGIFFLYAGNRPRTSRTGLYWPHRSSFSYKGKRWAYFICPEGGKRIESISVVAHEFGHMLGLPDLYAQDRDSKGLGIWCTMSIGHGQDGKPLHFSAWCKEQLGWIKPAIIDPRVKQKLILAPIENSPRECYKVLIRPDGGEYLLLENRVARGFDRDLPGQGLLIWRVVDGSPILEESHGINGPEGPSRYMGSIPYPSPSNHAYTPVTTPSSKPKKDGGLPVYITNIRKLPDGRITFLIGYEYL